MMSAARGYTEGFHELRTGHVNLMTGEPPGRLGSFSATVSPSSIKSGLTSRCINFIELSLSLILQLLLQCIDFINLPLIHLLWLGRRALLVGQQDVTQGNHRDNEHQTYHTFSNAVINGCL